MGSNSQGPCPIDVSYSSQTALCQSPPVCHVIFINLQQLSVLSCEEPQQLHPYLGCFLLTWFRTKIRLHASDPYLAHSHAFYLCVPQHTARVLRWLDRHPGYAENSIGQHSMPSAFFDSSQIPDTIATFLTFVISGCAASVEPDSHGGGGYAPIAESRSFIPAHRSSVISCFLRRAVEPRLRLAMGAG